MVVQKSLDTLGLPISNHVGDYTNELDQGDFITHFVSAGSKNYAYKTSRGAGECKVRGFTLSYNAAKKINYNAIEDIVLNDPQKTIVTTVPDQIFRDKHNYKIYSRDMQKHYSMVNDKRIYLPDHTSLPYGYYHEDKPDVRVDRYFNVISPEERVVKYKYYDIEADDLEWLQSQVFWTQWSCAIKSLDVRMWIGCKQTSVLIWAIVD